jgi:hypothetical protein
MTDLQRLIDGPRPIVLIGSSPQPRPRPTWFKGIAGCSGKCVKLFTRRLIDWTNRYVASREPDPQR